MELTQDAAMPPRWRIHDAWIVLGAVVFVVFCTSGLRGSFGVFIKPLEAEFGWTRSMLSGVASLSLLLWGATGPVVGYLADRWGPRRVILVAVSVLGVGSLLTSEVSTLWQLYLTVGLLMPVGAGGLGPAITSIIAARWFETHRGLVVGLFGAALSAGQLVGFPLTVWLTLHYGWRNAFLWLGVGLLATALLPTFWFVRDDPAEKGVQAYGAGKSQSGGGQAPAASERRVTLSEALQVPAFWWLAITFFICGYTTVGLISTHFVPHTVEHGFSEMHAAQALGVMGAMNIVGTIASGWICDHFGRKGPLALYYGVRGLSLLFLLYVWDVPSLHVFAAIFGLNFISTIPPTTALTANIFGRYSVGTLLGWIFFAHQLGAALGAQIGGWLFDATGSYTGAFLSAAVLAFLGSGLVLLIKEEPIATVTMPAPTPVAVPAS